MGNVYSSGIRPSICDESAVPAGKWVRWFPYLGTGLVNATQQCFQALHDHPAAHVQFGDGDLPGTTCPNAYDLIACVWDEMPAVAQLNMASAQVLLGLTPTIISILSSSIGEVSMLSSSRPVLSLLLSIGSPALFAIRALEYDNPLDAIKDRLDPCSKPSLFHQRRRLGLPGRREALISLAQYLLALACAANVIELGWEVGLQTVVVWKAGLSSLLFLWSTFAAVVHLTAALSWHISETMQRVRDLDKEHAKHVPSYGPLKWRALLVE